MTTMMTMTRRNSRRRRRRNSAAPLLAAGPPQRLVVPPPQGGTPQGQGQRACHCGHQQRMWSLLTQRGTEILLQGWSGQAKIGIGQKE